MFIDVRVSDQRGILEGHYRGQFAELDSEYRIINPCKLTILRVEFESAGSKYSARDTSPNLLTRNSADWVQRQRTKHCNSSFYFSEILPPIGNVLRLCSGSVVRDRCHLNCLNSESLFWITDTICEFSSFALLQFSTDERVAASVVWFTFVTSTSTSVVWIIWTRKLVHWVLFYFLALVQFRMDNF
jgi:hypothetical protein